MSPNCSMREVWNLSMPRTVSLLDRRCRCPSRGQEGGPGMALKGNAWSTAERLEVALWLCSDQSENNNLVM